MSEESSCKDLDGQLPRTDFFTNLLKMHINLAPNEPPPVTLRERSHFSPLLESQSLPDFHTHQWNSGLSSDEEETPAYTLMHTRNRTHNHNQSNNSLPPRSVYATSTVRQAYFKIFMEIFESRFFISTKVD